MWPFSQRDLIRDVVIILVVLLCNGETWDRRPLRFYPMSIIKQTKSSYSRKYTLCIVDCQLLIVG